MGIGASILLLAVGAILAFAVKATTIMGVQVHVVGYILMAAGVVGLIWSLILLSMTRRRVVTTAADPLDAPVVVHRHVAAQEPVVTQLPVVAQQPVVAQEDDREYRPGGF